MILAPQQMHRADCELGLQGAAGPRETARVKTGGPENHGLGKIDKPIPCRPPLIRRKNKGLGG